MILRASSTKEQVLRENAIKKSRSFPPTCMFPCVHFYPSVTTVYLLVCVLSDNLKEANYVHHLSDNLFAPTQHRLLVQNQFP